MLFLFQDVYELSMESSADGVQRAGRPESDWGVPRCDRGAA